MERRFFGLLVGIDTYPDNDSKLRGCVNDVNHINDYLKEYVTLSQYIETLKNSDATRENIIGLFRRHLGKAGENDVVFFHYSGHGSREIPAPAFNEYFSESKSETLVCYDSRLYGGYDLADKELAVLLWEVAKKNPHIVVSLDCCHSGSGSRGLNDTDELNMAGVRQIPGRYERKTQTEPRPLESYLDGFYKNMDTIRIPRSRHVLMAACRRKQKAWETKDHRGVFSTTLLEVLAKSGPDINYADLFVRCRTEIYKRVKNQTPQFETYSHFIPYAKFLDGRLPEQKNRYHVYYQRGYWKMECGAMHGLPQETGKVIEVALYPESTRDAASDRIAGYGKVISLGAQKSKLTLDFKSSRSSGYYAEIISLPVPPLPVLLEAPTGQKNLVKDLLTRETNVVFTDESQIARYALSIENNRFFLRQTDTGVLLQGAEGDPRHCCTYMFSILKRIIRWEQALELQNHKTNLTPEEVDLKFFEVRENGMEIECRGSSQTINFLDKSDGSKEMRARLRVRNQSAQKLHVTLVYLSGNFGIYILRNELLLPGKDYVTLWGEDENDYIKLPEGINETMDTFKLLVSTERVDDFLLIQRDLEPGKIRSIKDTRDISGLEDYKRKRKRKITNDWFTKTLIIKTVKQQVRAR